MAEAALVARLEARMDKYEKAMKGAEETADRTVDSIEKRFSAAQFGDRLGREIGKGLKDAFNKVVQLVKDTVEQFKEMERAAALVGITLQEAFALEKVGGKGTVEAFQKIATEFDKMQRGEKNFLSKVFDANGIENVKTAVEAFDHIRRLINDLQSGIQADILGKAFDFSTENVDNIRKARDNFNGLKEAAKASAPDMEHLQRLGKEFQETWEAALTGIKSAFLTTFNGLKNIVNDFVRDTATVLRALDFGPWLKGGEGQLGRLAGELEDASRRGPAGESGRVRALGGIGQTGAKAAAAGRSALDTSRRGASLPDLSKEEKAKRDRLDALEREQRRATERTAQMELEGKLIGQNVETRTRELEVLRLTQMAEREKIKLTDKVRMKIDETAEAYGQAAGKLDELVRKNQQWVGLQNLAGNMLVDSLMQATEAGAKFADIMADISKQIARAALQALILGQGPLAGLFGTAPTAAGQTGGLIGNLFKALPKFQEGGVVPGSGPVPIMAHGGEVVVPKAVAQHIGGASVSINQTIDARGAQAGVADQIAAAMAANNRALQMSLPAMIRNSQSRGALR